ncbi:uncharacterized protein LOC125042954 [Penaeus chinensis]|uniref:uncharacterized protein LOC125042954 n=1 Tax=Penaeus chinensis TaxID=139456 RepID=UPI001FB5E59B|nr:uncharacterized protein LOC125042954 [Penaeus chinensis]
MMRYIKRQPAAKMERQRNGTREAHTRVRGALLRVAALVTVMATLMALVSVSSFLSPNAEPGAVEGSGLEMPHVTQANEDGLEMTHDTQVNGRGLEMPNVNQVNGGGLEKPHVTQRNATQQRASGSVSRSRQSPDAQPKIVVTRSAKVRTRVFNAVSEALDNIFLNRSSQEEQPHNSIGLQEKRIKNSSRQSYEQGLSRKKRDPGQTDEKYISESQNQTQLSDNVRKPILVLELCSNIFKRIYDGELPPEPVIHYFSKDSKKFMKIFLQARFVDICLPLYRSLDICKEMKHLTICSDLVVFLHTHDCQRPSEYDKYFEVLLLRTLVQEDYNCFQLICDGMYRIVVQNVSGITVEVWVNDHGNDQCGEYYSNDEVIDFLADKEREVIIWTINTFFPCCYSVHGAVWLGVPADRGMNKFWDYLPFSCRVAEIALVCLVALVGLSGALGNLLVVVVMLTGDDEGESCILRTSLAFADLFTSVFVILPSLFDHLSPILEIYDLKENYQVIEHLGKTRRIQFANFADVYETKNSFRVFQGLVLGVCSFVSLFTLFMLSCERLILTGRALQYQHYFSVPRIKIVIIITWITALLNTLTFMYDGDGGFTVTWSSLTKLPVSLSLSFSEAYVVNLLFLIQVGLLVFLCIGILFFSIASIVKFAQEQTKVAAEWKYRNMRVSGPFSQENRYILSTMVMMTLLFMMSTVPKAVKTILDHTSYKFANVFLMEYLSWWMFVSGSAWNPWVYNMRSQRFRKDTLNVVQGMIPRRLKERLRRPDAADRRRERERAQEKMLRRLGLVDDQS